MRQTHKYGYNRTQDMVVGTTQRSTKSTGTLGVGEHPAIFQAGKTFLKSDISTGHRRTIMGC